MVGALNASLLPTASSALTALGHHVCDSMISTANYEARKYGVRAAMPGFIAVKLCPQLIFVNSDFAKYTEGNRPIVLVDLVLFCSSTF